jgi:hypothetical protein
MQVPNAGPRLVVLSQSQTVPFDTPTIGETQLEGYDLGDGVLPAGLRVVADLTEHEIDGILELETVPNEPFRIPRLRLKGEYQHSNIRLVDGDELLAYPLINDQHAVEQKIEGVHLGGDDHASRRGPGRRGVLAYLTAANTGRAPVNLLSLTLTSRELSGVELLSSETQRIDQLLPGDSDVVEFRLRSQRTGRGVSSFAMATPEAAVYVGLSPATLQPMRTRRGVPSS